MLESIEIQDFQSIASAQLRLGRFTVLVGPSSTGKSAVLRAIRLLARNGSGTSYVRVGCTKTKVTAHFSDAAVSITRGTKVNEYEVLADGEPKTWAKCGTSTPDAVASVINIGDESLSTQHDPPYLLASTAGEVAVLLGELTGADIAQDASKAGKDAAKTWNDRGKALTEGMASAAESLSTLPSIEDLTNRAEVAAKVLQGAERAAEARSLLDQYRALAVAADQPVPPEPPDLQEVLNLWDLFKKGHDAAAAYRVASQGLEQALEAVGTLEAEAQAALADLGLIYSEADICDHCPIRTP